MDFVFPKKCAKFYVKLIKENSRVLNFHLPGFELVLNSTLDQLDNMVMCSSLSCERYSLYRGIVF